MPRPIHLLLSGFLATALAAQPPSRPPGAPEPLEDLLNTPIITASRIRQPGAAAPAKVVVITAEDIRRRGYQDLEEVLHDAAGFDFEKGMGVHWSQIYMRGERSTNSDRFIFLWDGVIQNDIWAQVAWLERQYPLSNIARIEIMYGPASLLYGSNAMSGIINVITRREGEVDGVEVDVRRGAFATEIVELNAGKAAGAWRFMFNARWLRSQERDLTDETWTDRAGRTRFYGLRPELLDLASLARNVAVDRAGVQRAEYENGQLWAMKNGYWTPFSSRFGRESLHRFMEAGVGYGDWSLRIGTWYKENSEDAWTTPQSLMGASWNAGANFVSLQHRTRLSETWSSTFQTLMRTTSLEPTTEEPDFTKDRPWDPSSLALPRVKAFGPFIGYKLFNREYRGEYHLAYQDARLTGLIGGEFTAGTVYENYYTRTRDDEPWSAKPQHAERNAALVINGQYKCSDRLSLAIGTRLERNWEAAGPGGFGSQLTSRAALIWAPDPAHVLKLIYGQAFQSPQPFKKYSTNPSRPFPSPALRPEHLNALEIGYEFFPRFYWRNAIHVFQSDIRDKIELVPLPDLPGGNRFLNRSGVRIRGCEVESRYFFDSDTSLFLNLTANQARDKASGRDTGGIASLQANLGAEWLFAQRLSVCLRAHIVAARRTAQWDSANSLTVRDVAPYHTLDLTLGWLRICPGLDGRLVLNNLTNARYFDPGVRSADGQYYNGAILQQPFRAALSVTYRF